MELFKKLAEQKKYLETLGYNVLYIGLIGSQNYGLDDENSDVDSRAIVLSSLNQIIKKEKISIKIEHEYGQIDVKDVMTFYEVVRKGNFTFLEAIQTKYYIGDKYFRTLFGNIQLNLRSLKGDMYNKAEDFLSLNSSKKYEMDKWGYEPKQLHHLFRLMELMDHVVNYENNSSFIEYGEHNRDAKQWLLDVKRNNNNIIDNFSPNFIDISSTEKIKKWIDKHTEKTVPKEYKYEPCDLLEEVTKYIHDKLKVSMYKSEISYVRQYRTFDQPIPKADLMKFDKLKELNGQDIVYVVYESLEVL